MWYNTFDSAFFLTMAGIGAGVIGVVVNGCLKSRCKEVSIFGAKCIRDTQAEEEEAIAGSRANNLVAQSV
jgi:hypothetical protein